MHFLNSRSKLIIRRSAQTQNSQYEMSAQRIKHFTNLAETNIEFNKLLELIMSKKSISPKLIEQAANIINEDFKENQ